VKAVGASSDTAYLPAIACGSPAYKRPL
jgi:hypothetical protein